MSKDRNRVLVVDDDPGMLRGVQRLLRQHAYEPILFSSAGAFKNHTDFDRAVCVVLDINLNDGSGIELRLRLKADGFSVAGYLHERNDDAAVREAALASGCIAFQTKPFSAQELMEPLKRAVTCSNARTSESATRSAGLSSQFVAHKIPHLAFDILPRSISNSSLSCITMICATEYLGGIDINM
jgi:FixJ family two-component response regulator